MPRSLRSAVRWLARRVLPPGARWRLLRAVARPAVGRVRFGDLDRPHPFNRRFALERGTPIDRFYIERFLEGHAAEVRGRVLEVGEDLYTRRYGGAEVTRSEILHGAEDNPRATFVDDLESGKSLPSDAFDCIICTQTLQLIPDLRAAAATLHRILVPGGAVLVSLPGISQIYRDEAGRWTDYWRFTSASARWVFEAAFPADGLRVAAVGNPLVATAFLYGVAAEELGSERLEAVDPDYHFLVLVHARKPAPADSAASDGMSE